MKIFDDDEWEELWMAIPIILIILACMAYLIWFNKESF